ncbi:MAG: hypothetical protein V1802_00880 [Candidatus Aenigmatarchaeota archaeon]
MVIMGCPNFFKFHTNATLDQYCKRFGYDQDILEQTVKKTEQYNAVSAPNEEQRMLNALLHMDEMKMTDGLYFFSVKEMGAAYQNETPRNEGHKKRDNEKKHTSESFKGSNYSIQTETISKEHAKHERTNTLQLYFVEESKSTVSIAFSSLMAENDDEISLYNEEEMEGMKYIEYIVSEDEDDDKKKRCILIRTTRRIGNKRNKIYSPLKLLKNMKTTGSQEYKRIPQKTMPVIQEFVSKTIEEDKPTIPRLKNNRK